MAKRENQGLQIAVILLTMATLLFLITTVIFWNQSKKHFAQAEQDKAARAQADASASKISLEDQEFKTWLGYPPETSFETIKPEVEKLLSGIGPNFAPEHRNFKELPTYLINTIQAKNNELTTAANEQKQLRAERDQAVTEKNEAIAVKQAAFDKQKEDYLKEREKWEADVAQRRAETDKALADSRRTQESLARKNALLDQEVKRLAGELASLGEKNDRMKLQISQYEKDSFDRPNGRITWVNQTLRTVYLDLGSADSLRPQATFSIFDADANNLTRVEKKGSLEVTRILGDHLAEARILDDRVSQPILAGDLIYSPIFQKGNPIHFALAGIIDADGDGTDDRELVRNLIAISGGVIDAEVGADGKRTGEITIDTRYLVVGEQPKSGNKAVLAGTMKKIQEEADIAGVTKVSVDRFLSDIGYQHATRTVGLGANAKAADFKPNQSREQRFKLPKPKRPAAAPASSGGTEP